MDRIHFQFIEQSEGSIIHVGQLGCWLGGNSTTHPKAQIQWTLSVQGNKDDSERELNLNTCGLFCQATMSCDHSKVVSGPKHK